MDPHAHLYAPMPEPPFPHGPNRPVLILGQGEEGAAKFLRRLLELRPLEHVPQHLFVAFVQHGHGKIVQDPKGQIVGARFPDGTGVLAAQDSNPRHKGGTHLVVFGQPLFMPTPVDFLLDSQGWDRMARFIREAPLVRSDRKKDDDPRTRMPTWGSISPAPSGQKTKAHVLLEGQPFGEALHGIAPCGPTHDTTRILVLFQARTFGQNGLTDATAMISRSTMHAQDIPWIERAEALLTRRINDPAVFPPSALLAQTLSHHQGHARVQPRMLATIGYPWRYDSMSSHERMEAAHRIRDW